MERLVLENLRLVFYFVVLEGVRDFLNLCRQRHCIVLFKLVNNPVASTLSDNRKLNLVGSGTYGIRRGQTANCCCSKNLLSICRNCSKASRMPTMSAIPQSVSAQLYPVPIM